MDTSNFKEVFTSDETKKLRQRVAELEAVLRECREEVLARAWGLPYNFDALVAKIDEVLNVKE